MNINQYGYNKYNYWTIPLNELPTRGIFYNQNAVIKLRGLSVMEVKFLATYQPVLATEICNEILTKCSYFENIAIEDLYLPDRQYLIFWIRNNSFGNRNGYKIEIDECEHCKQKYTKEISLDQFNIKYLNYGFEDNIWLPDLKLDLPLTIPKFRDSLYKPEDDIQTIALYINSENTFKERCTFIENLSAYDYATLISHLDKYYCGFQTVYEIQCPHCNGTSHVQLKITDDNLFSFVKLFDILETITRISKYANLQITNDWSWIEVEIEQEVVNKLCREEEEQAKKEVAKAKAQAHIPSTPSIPHH